MHDHGSSGGPTMPIEGYYAISVEQWGALPKVIGRLELRAIRLKRLPAGKVKRQPLRRRLLLGNAWLTSLPGTGDVVLGELIDAYHMRFGRSTPDLKRPIRVRGFTVRLRVVQEDSEGVQLSLSVIGLDPPGTYSYSLAWQRAIKDHEAAARML